MTHDVLQCGFMPLTDAAPLIVAREIGFAAEEGIDLRLHAAPSWSVLRDRLALGSLDAAHMLAPVPVAMSMGLGGLPVPLAVPSLLSVNGTVIGVSRAVAERMAEALDAAPRNPWTVGKALVRATTAPIRIGVPFPFSMHAELLYHWFEALGVKASSAAMVRTVPPPLMAEALEAGEIEAFCVGEPWGSIAVERGVGTLILPGAAIWGFAPEKALALRAETCEARREIVERFVRALWRAGRWLGDAGNRIVAAEILAAPAYLDVSAEIVERALSGTLVADSGGMTIHHPRLMEFSDGAAGFPWRSQAIWIARHLAARNGISMAEADKAARACFRPDIYRTALDPLRVDMPGASEKVEGALTERTAVASSQGTLFLGPDSFFDGQRFDPNC